MAGKQAFGPIFRISGLGCLSDEEESEYER